MKNILCAIFMIITSICIIAISIVLSLLLNINSRKIVNSINDTSYTEIIEEEVETLFSNYLDEDELTNLMKKISVQDDIEYIVNSINISNEIGIYNIVYDKTNDIILSVIDRKEINQEEKEKYASTITKLYINEIFPVKEYSSMSKIYNQYISKVKLTLVIAFLLAMLCSIYSLTDIKTSKWTIISLYNAIIADILIVISFGIFRRLTISNTAILNVILDLIKNIRFTLVIVILFLILVVISLNYIKYIKRSSKKQF